MRRLTAQPPGHLGWQEQQHPGRNDQWGHRWTFSNELHHQRKCIMEQGLCSHFLLFFLCFLISSAHVAHGTFLAPQLQDALAAAFIQFPEKLTSHILAIEWNSMQFNIVTMPSFASNYFTAWLLLYALFMKRAPLTKCLFCVRI